MIECNIPVNYLCPPIPGRADYIHYIADLIGTNHSNQIIKGLDIGVGANCIYPILASRIYNWHMVGSDICLFQPKSIPVFQSKSIPL